MVRRNKEPGEVEKIGTGRPLIVIGGTTASGKSALALALAEAFDATVVNGDALQMYRDLRILSARPDAAAEARAPHRLYGALDGAVRGSVGAWLELARETLESLDPGVPAVLTGGTGMYLRAAIEGLSRIPPVPAAVSRAAEERFDASGFAAFHADLAVRDPASATLKSTDRQRLVRAWSVLEATGRPLSDWQRDAPVTPPLSRRVAQCYLLPPRDGLYAACDARFLEMIEQGAIAEVERLLTRALDPLLPVMKAVGVPEIAAFLRKEIGRDEMIRRGQTATRRYAKRQYTWFRRQTDPRFHENEQYSESLYEKIFPKIRHFLLTPDR
jgi:tRNA dimethylallyltransferase